MPCGCQPKPPDYEHTNLHENWKLNYIAGIYMKQ